MPASLFHRHARRLRASWLAAVVLVLAACATTPDVPAGAAAEPIDLVRFMGTWHVIARVPYVGERGHVASSQLFALDEDGDVAIRYDYRKGFDAPLETVYARATVGEGTGNRLWTTWLFRVIPTRYRILEVAPDYSWALVDHPGRDLAWIIARERVVPKEQYRELEDRIGGHGVNTDKLRRVPQVREQVGQLGFADPAEP
jgi:apolipoprotein D and lipocalin family protein